MLVSLLVWWSWGSERADSSKKSAQMILVPANFHRCNISPLIAEQYREDRPYIRVLPSGERIIVDSAATISRIFLYFYMMINIGSLVGQIGMVYAERYVGFWLSFLLPTVMFCTCPTVMFLCRNYYYRAPPSGSVYSRAFRLWRLAMKGRWSLNPMKL